MSDEQDPEELAALAVLDSLGRLDGPDETSVPSPEDEVEAVLRRLYTETVGLLPYALDPAAADPALKRRLLTGILGDFTQEIPRLATPAPVAAALAPSDEPRPERPPAPAPRSAARAATRRRRRFAPALAAGLALAALGLGFGAAYLHSELKASEVRLAWMERQWKGEATAARGELAELRRRFDRVTSAAVTVFSMRCPIQYGPAAGARAMLYVAPDRRSWELAVHGLAPEPPGRDYQLWFMVGDQPRSAGCFKMRDGQPVLAMTREAPPGVTGAAVTVEPAGGSPRPTTPSILVAAQPVRL